MDSCPQCHFTNQMRNDHPRKKNVSNRIQKGLTEQISEERSCLHVQRCWTPTDRNVKETSEKEDKGANLLYFKKGKGSEKILQSNKARYISEKWTFTYRVPGLKNIRTKNGKQ